MSTGAADTVATLATTADHGEAPEREVAHDLLRKVVPVLAALVLVGLVLEGAAGAISAGYAVALVSLNFLVAATLMTWSARISLALLMGTVLFGYAVRLGLLFLAVWAVRGAGWYEPVPLGVALVTSHLGLLAWELRHVSASLAFPGLHPAVTKESAT